MANITSTAGYGSADDINRQAEEVEKRTAQKRLQAAQLAERNLEAQISAAQKPMTVAEAMATGTKSAWKPQWSPVWQAQQAYQQPIGPRPMGGTTAIPGFMQGPRAAFGNQIPTIELSKTPMQEFADGVTQSVKQMLPLATVAASVTTAFALLKGTVDAARVAEDARRSRAMGANEALGMIGNVDPEVAKMVRSGAKNLSPTDATEIASMLGSAYGALGPAASGISPEQRSAQLRSLLTSRQQGVSMTALGRIIGQTGSPLIGFPTAAQITGVPQQTNFGLEEVFDKANREAGVAVNQDVRTPFKDFVYQADVVAENLRSRNVPGLLATPLGFLEAARQGARSDLDQSNGGLLRRIAEGITSMDTRSATQPPSPMAGQ